MNVTAIDIEHLRSWIGRLRVDHDVVSVRQANLMAATLGNTESLMQEGDALPPLWHWLYFLEGRPPAELGRDGHPSRGGFLPPVPLPNRMWAGGRLVFPRPVPLGAQMERRSEVIRVEHKKGRSGDLVFVTVLHEVLVDHECCIREEHDIVYKEASPPGTAARIEPVSNFMSDRQLLVPDSTTLFRYSALTFNGHRIHYDQDYCRQVEGYSNLVIHGPLIATLLARFAEKSAGRPLSGFNYRGLRPAILGDTLTLEQERLENVLKLRCSLMRGVAMEAEATMA